MDIVALYTEAKNVRSDITVDQVQEILNSIDRAGIEARERQRYSYEIWDKRSPINGVPAEHVIASRGIEPDDVVYLIYHDGRLVFFQDRKPNGERCFSDGEAQAAAEAQIDELVQRAVNEQVRQQVLRRIVGLLTVTSDKEQVYSNGQDTAMITASSIDLRDGDQVTFNIPGVGSITATAAGGKATIPFTTEVPGDWPITASHPTLGRDTVLVRGV